jgi:hydroxyacylglutathione hydrolase
VAFTTAIAVGQTLGTLDVRPIPAFQDNYIWLLHGLDDPRAVAVVDPGAAEPVLRTLADGDLRLDAILATHHHADHVGGVRELVAATGAMVFGPARERMPVAVHGLAHGARARLPTLGLEFEVIDVPGHTAGHIAYFGHEALFCGDTLFSAGCGRLFEGTAEQMLASLDSLARLPDSTRVFCGHEYTLANLRFAMAVEAGNSEIATYARTAEALRAASRPTLPSTIGLEKRVNPFLRSRLDNVRSSAERHAGTALPTPVAVFAEVRSWKDTFR